MINVITIDREYGTGGAEIAAKLAAQLGWKLWDQALTTEIAKQAKCAPAEVERREERRDPLSHRLFKSFVRGAFEGNINTQPIEMLDADRIVALTQEIVKRAAREGNCVIVGRGSACFLQECASAFHVFIYAPPEEKIRRLMQAGRSREQALDLSASVDRDRSSFIKNYFGKNWPNRDLFQLMLNSQIGDDAVIQNIMHAISVADRKPAAARAI